MTQVAALAASLAPAANPYDGRFNRLARAAGLLHDLGKYTEPFQSMLLKSGVRKAPHSASGAALAHTVQAVEAAFTIAGHHAGLRDAERGRAYEVQTLPRQFVGPILDVMRSLADDRKTTFLFCTATQPAFAKSADADPKDERWEPGSIQEIIPQPATLFERLKRAEVSWHGEGRTPWSICTIRPRSYTAPSSAGLRTEALTKLRSSTSRPECVRLTNSPVSRRSGEGSTNPSEGCLVVSTQPVEAGVDVDFPVVYRAMGPLDSIAPAAGRCDREGKLTVAAEKPAGRVVVFETEDGKLPRGAYGEATTGTRALARKGSQAIHRPDDVRRHFELLFGEADLDAKDIQELRHKMSCRHVAREFEMIVDSTQSVFVPYDGAVRELIARLEERGILDSWVRRSLQRYVVGLDLRELQEARRGAVHGARPASDLWVCSEGFYDENLEIITRPMPEDMVL